MFFCKSTSKLCQKPAAPKRRYCTVRHNSEDRSGHPYSPPRKLQNFTMRLSFSVSGIADTSSSELPSHFTLLAHISRTGDISQITWPSKLHPGASMDQRSRKCYSKKFHVRPFIVNLDEQINPPALEQDIYSLAHHLCNT